MDILIFWKLTKEGQTIIEGPIEIIISTIKKMGDNFIIKVHVKECWLDIVGYKTEFNRSEQIKKGIKERQLEEFRKNKNYIDDPNYKFCTSCKRSKLIDEFGFRNNSSDGRARQCRDCVNAQAKKRRKRNKNK